MLGVGLVLSMIIKWFKGWASYINNTIKYRQPIRFISDITTESGAHKKGAGNYLMKHCQDFYGVW